MWRKRRAFSPEVVGVSQSEIALITTENFYPIVRKSPGGRCARSGIREMTCRVTILGCGSSGGVPRVGAGWGACDPH